jgi:hypothetical protein
VLYINDTARRHIRAIDVAPSGTLARQTDRVFADLSGAWRTGACREEIMTGIGGAPQPWREPSVACPAGKRVVPMCPWPIGTQRAGRLYLKVIMSVRLSVGDFGFKGSFFRLELP